MFSVQKVTLSIAISISFCHKLCKQTDTFSAKNTKTAVGMDISIKTCAWTLTLVNIRNNVNKTSKTCFGLHRFFFNKPTDWQLSNGSQFCSCYTSKNITNYCCVWLRKRFENIRDVSVFVSRIVANTRPWENISREGYEPYLQLLYSLHYGQIDFCVTQLELLSPTQTAVLCSFNLFPSLCQSVHSILTCNRCSRPCKQCLCIWRQRVCTLVSENIFVTHFNAVIV